MHRQTHAHTYINTHTHTHTHTHVSMCVCVCVYLYYTRSHTDNINNWSIFPYNLPVMCTDTELTDTRQILRLINTRYDQRNINISSIRTYAPTPTHTHTSSQTHTYLDRVIGFGHICPLFGPNIGRQVSAPPPRRLFYLSDTPMTDRWYITCTRVCYGNITKAQTQVFIYIYIYIYIILQKLNITTENIHKFIIHKQAYTICVKRWLDGVKCSKWLSAAH